MTFVAGIRLDPDRVIAPVPKRLFGTLIEHMGRCVYTGIYEPGHPAADSAGMRADVLTLTRELGVTVARYPGGNFVSGYHWQDGIGPKSERPRRLETAWHEIETNQFGLHEFADWAHKAGIEIMQAVNLGTEGIREAMRLLEYANHPSGTELSDRRIANGAADPFDIKLWCLGNEMDGPWQLGHMTATEYGRLAAETAKGMRLVDPSIELVVAGSSSHDMPTFGAWETEVLRHTYPHVDYLSVHAYVQESNGDAASFLGASVGFERYLRDVLQLVDDAQVEGGHSNRIDLAIDEWNVWYLSRHIDPDHQAGVAESEWTEHPRVIEDEYNVTDAVVVATLLHSLLRHADRVKIANIAQLVNVIAPIRTEENGPAWRQTTFYPFARVAALASGQVLDVQVTSPGYVADAVEGTIAFVDASATHDPDRARLAVFAANRSLDDSAQVDIDVSAFDVSGVLAAEVLGIPDGGDRFASNTEHEPNRVAPVALATEVLDGMIRVVLPPLSWGVLSLRTR